MCPNCGNVVDMYDVICPHCFEWIKRTFTKIRIRVNLSGEQDVFSMHLYGFGEGDKQVCYGLYRFEDVFGGDFEVVFSRHIEKFGIVFEEHWTNKSYAFKLDDPNEKQYGIEFFEKQSIYDRPTYAGEFTYHHPEFTYKVIPYEDIDNSPTPIHLSYN